MKIDSLRLIICFLPLAFATRLSAQNKIAETEPAAGMVIRHSVTFKKGVYRLAAGEGLNAVLVVDGDNISIDFNGAEIVGSENPETPDQFSGTGLLIKAGKHVVIKNAVIRGYKVGIMARDVNGLEISGCDLSYNYRQHLNSTRLKEDLSDWMSYHHNEKGEWLRFGAGIYLDHCSNAVIAGNTITNGQCALMMTSSQNGRIYNNTFSYNSGVGIGMYRSNYNQVLYNKVDWNVRGYSFGYYYRGQDSGGMLVFSQCHNNVFAHNSVTHSGDGFFLWAGQETIDKGIGGCNDNLIYDNDFSFAPTNAVEITFSRNKVIKNRLRESWHGIWGGFSYQTVIANNDFGGNLAAISIEHGQDNIIEGNRFTADSLGLELWAIPNRRADFGLMKVKDTRSRNYSIINNEFIGVPTVYSIHNTQHLTFAGNQATGYRTLKKTDTLVSDWQEKADVKPVYDYAPDSIYVASLLPGIEPQDPFQKPAHPTDKASIKMTEWGPYNYAYPLIWWEHSDAATGVQHFSILGPAGRFAVKSITGGKLIRSSAEIPGELLVKKDPKGKFPLSIELEFTGQSFTDPFGRKQESGKPYVFNYCDNEVPMHWEVSWYRFGKHTDPVKQPEAFEKLLADSTPIQKLSVDAGDFDRERGKLRDLPSSHFVAVVDTRINVPKGRYRLGVTAGELVRVYVDGKLVINSWDRSKGEFDADYHNDAILDLKGKHRLKIIKVQYGSYSLMGITVRKI